MCECRFRSSKAAPVEEATELVAKRNTVAVVGAGEVGLPWQLVQGGGGQDQVGHGSHQQHQGHPHGQSSICYDFPFVRPSPLIQLNLITNRLFSFISPLKYHSRPLKKVELKIQLSCDEYEVQ